MDKPNKEWFYFPRMKDDPRTDGFTGSQRGYYMGLLVLCLDSGDCSLPNDLKELKLLTDTLDAVPMEGLPENEIRQVLTAFMPHPTIPGKLTHTWLYDQWFHFDQWFATQLQKEEDDGQH